MKILNMQEKVISLGQILIKAKQINIVQPWLEICIPTKVKINSTIGRLNKAAKVSQLEVYII